MPTATAATAEQLQALSRACLEIANDPDGGDPAQQLVDRVSQILGTAALLYGREVSRWRPLSRTTGTGSQVPSSNIARAGLDRLFTPRENQYRPIVALDGSVWTPVAILEEAPVHAVVLLPGNWSDRREWVERFGQIASLSVRLAVSRRRSRATAAISAGAWQFARTLAQISGEDRLYQHIIDAAAKVANARFGSLSLLQPNAAAITVAATHGYPREEVQHVQIVPGTGIVGGVFSSKRPLLVRDTTRVPGLRPLSTRYQTTSFMALPIVAREEARAVVTLADRRDNQPFTTTDLAATRMIGAVAWLAMEREQLTRRVSELAQVAATDPVTGIFNRRYVHTRLHGELERSRRSGLPLTVMMLDVDTFKSVNDRLGHHTGDVVLRHVAETITSSVRTSDVCARYGGDEFAILVQESSERALHTAERIRHRIDTFPWDSLGVDVQRVTVSIGLATADASDTPETLMRRADAQMYEAKAGGRNRVHPRRM